MTSDLGKNVLEREKELDQQLYDLDNEKSEMENQVNQIIQEENEEYDKMDYSYNNLKKMKDVCCEKDYEILQIIEEKQQLLKELSS